MSAWSSSLKALLPISLTAMAALATPGCTKEAACFRDCNGSVDTAMGGNAGSTNLGGTAGTLNIGFGGDSGGTDTGGTMNVGGGVLEGGASDGCDKVDLKTDVNNCGTCGNVCIFTGATSMCVDGKCTYDCIEDRYDLDKNPDNGCEYACAPSADPTEICDNTDNDCDGVKDNGFDLTTDPNNCGFCGHKCDLLHATSECQPAADAPTCVVKDCEPGWYDVDGLDANGCEYKCDKTGLNGVACDPNDANCGVERCDAYDNDCNGIINDGNEGMGGPDGGQPCTDYCANGKCQGECTPGVSTCVGHDLVCIPGKGPTLETCDGLDNDCDGVKDNGFDLTSDPNNCGSCGVKCLDAFPNGVGQCTDPAGAPPPACTLFACKPGYKDLDPKTPGCEKCPKFPTTAETCNGIDDDCDGIIDNPAAIASQKPAVDAFCNNGRPSKNTPCAGTSVECGAMGWTCKYPTGTGIEIDPATGKVRVIEAVCDDTDGNCDGQKDEAFLNKGQDCAVGKGTCSRKSKYACTADGAGTECPVQAVATDAVDEICNGVDDDCDGQIDERAPVAGSKCYNGGAHDCLGYTDPMVKVGNVYVYKYEASRPDASAKSPGTYDVRSCSKAGVLPWTSISQTDAEKTCEAIPTSDPNTKMRLCTETEWQTACLAGGAGTSPTWAYSTTPSPYDDLVCNDAATGLNAPWVTAFNNGQTQRCRTSTQIFDMSGNVAEWTSSCLKSAQGDDYCRVRGGSFLTQGPATACGFSFVLDVPDFVNSDLGFRCCADAAP